MFAQRKAPHAPRSNPGSRYGYRPAPIRARVGLAMRRSMNFGDMPDAETVLRSSGLSLAPMSVGDAGLNVGGTSVLATASCRDIDNGALKALVVPAGAPDPEAEAALNDAIVRACAKGAPVFAFGEGVVATLRALGRPAGEYADAPAILVTGERIEALADISAVAMAAGRVG
ncbi:hypothetical protein [Brevundimonas sp. R86498]|uniref:hypothetical protein n=1 Tax=Brevundimonas sp. R86498 TaxID=3093845 RepID=UPI0037C53FDD